MGLMGNIVSAGDYKNADIKLKGIKGDKVVLVKKGLLGKEEIRLDKSTIARVEIKVQQYQQNQVEVEFRNGKKSLLCIDNDTLNKLNASMY